MLSKSCLYLFLLTIKFKKITPINKLANWWELINTELTNNILIGGNLNKINIIAKIYTTNIMGFDNQLLFTIGILTFNNEKTINGLLSNILYIAKTNKIGYEILIIDSGSTDKTIPIIKKKKKKFKRIRFIKIKHKEFNYGKTRNLASRLAKGKYLCFISADAFLPKKINFFKYFKEDFEINNRVVAVFGKQIPSNNCNEFFKLELNCRFNLIRKYLNQKGIFIQNKKNPLFDNKNVFIFSFISNVFACYKKSYLKKHPFPESSGAEDIIQGNKILNLGYTKIYDSRCFVIHSHNYSLIDYYQKQKRDYLLRYINLNIRGEPQFLCKIKQLLCSDQNILNKIALFLKLIFFYLIKVLVILEVKLLYDE